MERVHHVTDQVDLGSQVLDSGAPPPPPQEGEGDPSGQAPSSWEGALVWVARHLGCGPRCEWYPWDPGWAFLGLSFPICPKKGFVVFKGFAVCLGWGQAGWEGRLLGPPPAGAHWARDTT